jgi:tetratricopeptide (TPR) repeat protein
MQALFNDKQNAEELLNDAQQALRAAVSGSTDRLLRSRGQFGIARAAEALGKLDEAVEEYKKVIEINESEAMTKKAQERIDSLSKPETKEFVSWFADQDFSPADPSLPPALPGNESLPDLPDFKLPPLDLGAAGESTSQPPTGGLELPAADPSGDNQGGDAKSGEAPKPDAAGESQPADAAAPPAGEASESAPEASAPEASAPEASAPEAAPETGSESPEADSSTTDQ